MNRPSFAFRKRLMMVLLLLSGLAGCSGEKAGYTVTGLLVADGKPLQVSSERMPPGTRPLQIIFHALPRDGGAAGESFYCNVNSETGEFTVKGPSDKGIPAGKYRISVAVLSAAPRGRPGVGIPPGAGGGAASPPGMLGMSDKLQGAFSRERSRLEVEISGAAQLLVDVGSKPGVSAR